MLNNDPSAGCYGWVLSDRLYHPHLHQTFLDTALYFTCSRTPDPDIPPLCNMVALICCHGDALRRSHGHGWLTGVRDLSDLYVACSGNKLNTVQMAAGQFTLDHLTDTVPASWVAPDSLLMLT